MTFESLSETSRSDTALEAMIASVESAWSCRVTIHDILGRVSHEPGGTAFNGRTMHTHSFCQWRRYQQAGWHAACNQHCLINMTNDVLAGPGCHRCWKGVQEVVIPVVRKHQHLFTLFAGAFKGTLPEGMKEGSEWLQRWESLPELSAGDVGHIAAQLQMLGQVLLQETQETSDQQQLRPQLIDAFIREHAHQPIGLADLARHLCISEGQCSRETKRLMGKSFRKLLVEERLKRAAILMTNYDLSLDAVARRVGFTDQYHFSRSFKHRFGLPPGQWRRRRTEGGASTTA